MDNGFGVGGAENGILVHTYVEVEEGAD